MSDTLADQDKAEEGTLNPTASSSSSSSSRNTAPKHDTKSNEIPNVSLERPSSATIDTSHAKPHSQISIPNPIAEAAITPDKTDEIETTTTATTTLKNSRTTEHESTSNPHPTTEERHDRRHSDLRSSIRNLESKISTTQQQLSQILSQIHDQQHRLTISSSSTINTTSTSTTSPSTIHNPNNDATSSTVQGILDTHVGLLQRYNEIRDIGVFLAGLVAEKSGRTTAEVLQDLNVNEDD